MSGRAFGTLLLWVLAAALPANGADPHTTPARAAPAHAWHAAATDLGTRVADASTTAPAMTHAGALFGYASRNLSDAGPRVGADPRVSGAGHATKGERALPRIGGGAPKPDEILRPGGSPIGNAGTSPGIREVSTRKQLDDLFEELSIHGSPTSSRYPGTGVDLPGGGFVGLRQSQRHGPTLDINIPGLRDVRKIHVRP